MTRPVRWFGHDARGLRLGIARASDEHPECWDLVGEIATGRVVLARMNAETWDAMKWAHGEATGE